VVQAVLKQSRTAVTSLSEWKQRPSWSRAACLDAQTLEGQFILLVACTALLPVMLTPGDSVASPGLVAAYSFEDGSGMTVADASGSGNESALVGATWASAGRFAGTLSFNVSSACVDVPGSSSLPLASGMTLEAWVKPATGSSA